MAGGRGLGVLSRGRAGHLVCSALLWFIDGRNPVVVTDALSWWCRGTVGVLLVGWVGGGLRIANEYLAKTEGRTRELSEEEESWVVAESAP